MKHIWKKAACALLALVCIASFTACGGSKDTDNGINEQMQTTLIQSAEGLSDAVVNLTDEEIKGYSESGDEFTEGVMAAWSGSREDLGSFKEFQEAVVEKDGTNYTVTLPGKFSEADGEFIYIFDKTGTPTSMSINVQYPMSVTLKRAGLNTLMGIGTVFIILIFLSFVISMFKHIPNPELKKKEAKIAALPAAPAPVPVAAADETNDAQLVAVIAAAIAAAEGTSPDGFVVRSIRKVNRKKW